MFTPIASEIIKQKKKNGLIKFFVFDGWDFVATSTLFTTVPHKIIYIEKSDRDRYQRVFDCNLTLDRYSLTIEDIKAHNENALSKPLEHMFLEMTIEAAGQMAKYNQKKRIFLTSKLSMFSEIASELGFMIKSYKFTNNFGAIKILK